MELFKKKIGERCAEKGITDYEIYYQLGESTSVSIHQQEVKGFATARPLVGAVAGHPNLGHAALLQVLPQNTAAPGMHLIGRVVFRPEACCHEHGLATGSGAHIQ